MMSTARARSVTVGIDAAIAGIAVPTLVFLGAATAHADPDSRIAIGIAAEAGVGNPNEAGDAGAHVGLSNPVPTRMLTLW